jgi:hypothetical protein
VAKISKDEDLKPAAKAGNLKQPPPSSGMVRTLALPSSKMKEAGDLKQAQHRKDI